MTINSDTRKSGPYLGDGTTVTLPFGFKVFQAADLVVVHTDITGVESTLVLGSDYSVSLNANQDTTPGGSITLAVAAASGTRTTIGSAIAPLQKIQLANNGGFYADVLNGGFDRVTILIQQLIEQQSRSLRVPFSDTAGGTEMANSVGRANKVLGFDSSGRPAYTVPASGSAADVALQLASLITDLASIAAGKGSALIAWIRRASGAVARRVEDKLAESVSVTDFGADPTGAADSTSAINAAIASLGQSGGTVYFPPGIYKTTATITITAPVRLVGAGRGNYNNAHKTVIRGVGTFDVIRFQQYAAWGGVFDLTVDTTSAAYSAAGIYCGSGRIDIARVSLLNHGFGLNIYDANCSEFRNVYTYNCAIGVYINGAATPDVNGMTFTNLDILLSRQDGIYIGQNSFANTFVGVCIQGSARYGINIASQRNIFVGTYSENNATAGVNFASTANYNFVEFSVSGDSTLISGNTTKTNGWRQTGGHHVPGQGIGIDFQNNSSAAGATSKAFGDYEEGTFTPSFTGLTTSGTVTYTGRYTKIGRMVDVTIQVQSTGSTSATLGTTLVNMLSLPYAVGRMNISTAANANSLAGIGQALISSAAFYVPAWSALPNVVISARYEV